MLEIMWKYLCPCIDKAGNFFHFHVFLQLMWLMLQQEKPDDYVVATGEIHSVREFVETSFKEIGEEIV